jgi:hypothetical protein
LEGKLKDSILLCFFSCLVFFYRDLDEDVAQGIAIGAIDPTNLLPMVDINPTFSFKAIAPSKVG